MSKVIIQECPDYQLDRVTQKLNEGMEMLGGWERFVQPGMKVLLKVNLIGPKTSDSAAITHAEFVRAITRILREKGCTVWIGDSSGGAIAGIAPTARGFAVSGLEQVAKEEGAEIKNFDKEGVFAVIPESKFVDQMYLAKPMQDADLVINLPKLKTHSAGIFTGAVKNLFGCIPGLRKAEYHRLAPDPTDLGQVIVDINKAVKVPLHIMDGITAMEGEGPTAGSVYHAQKILFSTDPLALDTVAARMIGLQVDDVPILSVARERRLGEVQLARIELIGDYSTVPELKRFKLPKRHGKVKPRNYKVLVKVIDLLKARPWVNPKLCKQCNMCVESCPVKAINQGTKAVDYGKCIECMCCHELCMYKAVELKRDNAFAGLAMKLFRGNYR